MTQRLSISVCTYQNGDFEVILQDPDTHEEITLSGNQKVEGDDFDLIQKLAPACVFTRYKMETVA